MENVNATTDKNFKTKRRARNSGGLSLKGGSTWFMMYRVGGKQFSESTGIKWDGKVDKDNHPIPTKEARAMLQDKIASLDRGETVAESGKLTYEQIRDAALAQADLDSVFLRERKEDKMEGDRLVSKAGKYFNHQHHLDKFFGGRKVKAINAELIRQFKTEMVAGGYSKATVNGALMVLTVMVSRAVKDKKIRATEAPVIEKFAKDSVNKRDGYLKHSEFVRLQKALPEHIRRVVTALYETGCRKEEVLGLTWGEIDLDGRRINLPATRTKNGQPRSIFLIEQDETLAILKGLRRENRFAKGSDLVFLNTTGQHIKGENKIWNRLCVKLGIRQSSTTVGTEDVIAHFDKGGVYHGPILHDLRRSYAHSIQEAGIASSVGQQLTGHLTDEMYARYAGKHAAEQLRDARTKRLEYLQQTA